MNRRSHLGMNMIRALRRAPEVGQAPLVQDPLSPAELLAKLA